MKRFVAFVLFLSLAAAAIASPARAMVCADIFSMEKGAMSRSARLHLASTLLGRKLNAKEAIAIDKAHTVGAGELGKSGKLAGPGTYKLRHILAKARPLRAAGLSWPEIRLLMENRVVGAIDQAAMLAAMQAEQEPPTDFVTIRSSGSLDQYTRLDTPELVGKRISVRFIDDRHQPGVETGAYHVPQLVLTQDYLDPASLRLVNTLKQESGLNPFREVGGWVLYTDRGVYVSNTFTSNDSYMIANDITFEGLENAYGQALDAEGAMPVVVDVEFYHTHRERGEAFSSGDQDFQERYFQRRVKKILSSGGTYSAYAVPVQGSVLFRNAIRKP